MRKRPSTETSPVVWNGCQRMGRSKSIGSHPRSTRMAESCPLNFNGVSRWTPTWPSRTWVVSASSFEWSYVPLAMTRRYVIAERPRLSRALIALTTVEVSSAIGGSRKATDWTASEDMRWARRSNCQIANRSVIAHAITTATVNHLHFGLTSRPPSERNRHPPVVSSDCTSAATVLSINHCARRTMSFDPRSQGQRHSRVCDVVECDRTSARRSIQMEVAGHAT